jgi:phospholipid/cholesterol/gamma-HCH transport system substrate-binding protein
MKNSLETKLGIFVVLVIFAAVFIVEILGSTDLFRHGYHVSALFDTVQDLKVGDRVKIAGVEIGKVDDITLTNNAVCVSMKLHSDVVVKTDSKATVRFAGLMGQNYVNVTFGTPGAPRLGDGDYLETGEQPDLNALMAKLDAAANGIQNLTKSFTPDTINNLMGPLVDFVKQNSKPLTTTISNITDITSQIAAGEGTVGKLIYKDALYNSALTTVSNLQDTAGTANEVLTTAKGVVTDVAAGKGTLGKLVTDDTLYRATTSSMTNLNSILQKVNQGQGTLGKLVNNQEFYNNAKLSLQKLDKAADGLEDTGPLSVMGIIANQFGL